MVTQLTISSKCTKGDILSNQLYWFALISLFSGNANTQSSPQTSLAPHASRRGSKKNALDDLAFEEVMRGKRQTLGDGHFDESGVWIPALKSTLSEESLKELNRGDGSFGKSLQKAQGLFARKRRDGSEQDKVAPVVSKSGRFGNEKPIDVKGKFKVFFHLWPTKMVRNVALSYSNFPPTSLFLKARLGVKMRFHAFAN